MKILHVIANPKPTEESASKQVTEAFLEGLKKSNQDAEITTLDLYENPPPYYSYEVYRHYWYPVFQPEYQPSDEEKKAAEYVKEQAAKFNDADILVITTPMWNFSMPAILKAWIDLVFSPSETFTMGPGGPKPLHKIKKVIVLCSSGGVYGEGSYPDHFSPVFKLGFGFIGIEDVEFVWADGQNPFFFKDSAERKAKAIEEARELGEGL